jgi:hypothetical protein
MGHFGQDLNKLKEMSNHIFVDPATADGWNDGEPNTLKTISGNDFEAVRMGAVTTQWEKNRVRYRSA